MLQTEVVGPGWLSNDQFLAGYGVTQAMPGPIFTFSSYLGAVIGANLTNTWSAFFSYAGMALLGVFMPSFGLVAALMPLWDRLRAAPRIRQALMGINATVIGLLLAALYQPVLTKALAVEQPAQAISLVLGC
jgi:chromate transporter